MFLSDLSIRRPVGMCCVIIAFILFGLNAYREMSVEMFPSVDLPIITIMTVYPGASPEEIETDVAKKIEDAVGTLDGLKHLDSACMANVCLTILEFELEVDVDIAATDVREKLDPILTDLPAEAEKPQILKFDVNATPIINLALTGDVSLDELYDYADNELKDRLSVITGVAEVELIGGAEREVHALLNRKKLAAYNLSSMDVVRAIQQGIRTIPSGNIQDEGAEYTVRYDADFDTVESIGDLDVLNRNGSKCYLRDIAQIVMTTDELRQAAFVNGRPAIAIRVVKKAEANAVQVVERVRETVEALAPLAPGGMEIIWVSDSGRFIQSSVNSTIINIGQGILLTALILFFFLYNFRTTFIVAATMPVTVIISLAFLGWINYSLNISTLLALGLSVGILVTNSIVVLESITSRLSDTHDPHEAARLGTRDVAIAVLASASTNVVVLFPIAVMGGRVGIFFKPFAITMIIVTLISLFISFTLTPILCSVLLRKNETAGRRSPLKWLEKMWNREFGAVEGSYAGFIRLLAQRRWASILVLLLVVIAFFQTLTLAPKVGFGFFEEADQGEIFVKLELPTQYNMEQTIERVHEVEKILAKLPHAIYTYSTVGKVQGVMGQASEGVYLAQVLATFPDKTQRETTIYELLDKTRDDLADIPDCMKSVSIPSIIGGQSTPIELVISGPDLNALNRIAEKTLELAKKIPGIADPDTTVRPGKPEFRIRPRRAILSDMGLPATLLGMALRANLAGIEAGTFKEGARSYDIRVKLDEETGKDQVTNFRFPGLTGQSVVLSNLAYIDEVRTPVQITRTDKQRVVKLLAQLDKGKPLGTAADEITSAMEDAELLPAGYTHRYAGMHESMAEAQGEFLKVIIMAILLTYLTLAMVLESFRQPFIILVTIPFALIGIIWALYLAGESIAMFVLLGATMLIGIVVNNAILIMDEVNQSVARGVSPREAIAEATKRKFRPIIMITLAAILGMLPLALGRGLGSELRNAIGFSSVGGIAVSAVLTLIVLPVLYGLLTFSRKSTR